MKRKLVVISAIWCPSCLILKKHLKKIREEFPNIEIQELDYDFDSSEVSIYEVGKLLPVIVMLEDDVEKRRLIGEKSYNEIKEFIGEGE